ncbi:TMM26 protein, partial [Amia calva]|nr:TMM26 protein [Amia calva]
MCKFLNVLLATLSRFLFAVHGVVTVWYVVKTKGDPVYWLLLCGIALLGVEMAVTLKFSPMVFLYLSTVIPSIWFLELNLLQSRHPNNTSSKNDLHLLDIPIPRELTHLGPENWAAGLEQTMLIVLVLGRWLMPKGDMSRDQLSQLLMGYMGLGADILDIFDTFKEKEVESDRMILLIGLSLFTWALLQFPLVLTQTNTPHSQSVSGSPSGKGKESSLDRAAASRWGPSCSTEFWALLVTVGMQDGPFLIYRLYLMIQEHVLNQMMIFFTCKNILIVLLDIYRIVVQFEKPPEEAVTDHSTPFYSEELQRPEGDDKDQESQA